MDNREVSMNIKNSIVSLKDLEVIVALAVILGLVIFNLI